MKKIAVFAPRLPRLLLGILLLSGVPVGAQAPSPGSGLGLLDAVRMMLERDPNLGIVQARLASSRGALLAAAGKFDPVITDQLSDTDTKLPLGERSSFEQLTVENDLGLSKLFRTGLSITPAVSLLRLRDT